MNEKLIYNIVPAFGRRSETFIKLRIQENESVGYKNIIYTDVVAEQNKSHIILQGDGRYRNKINQIIFSLKDIFNKKYNSINETHLLKSLAFYKPKVIHLHFGYQAESLLNVLAKIDFRPLVVVSLHGSDVLSFTKKSKNQGQVITKLVNIYDAIITVPSVFLQNKVAEKYHFTSNNIIVVPNAFEPSFSIQRKVQLIPSNSELIIVNVSRLTNWKGHKYLLEGISKFHSHYPEAKFSLKIIGDGEDINKLKSLASELNLNNNISFLGALPHHEVYKTIKKSNIFIHTAIKDDSTEQEESFGIALLEAIAAQLFCITTTTGGLKDVVGDLLEPNKNHIQCIEQKSASAVFGALEKLFLQGAELNPEYVKQRVNVFSIEEINKLWARIFSR